MLGLTALKIVHRQDVPGSAQTIAEMAGTERIWEDTHQLRGPFAPAGASRGTRREVERFIVHPNEVKTLPTGQAVMLTKIPTARVDRVTVSAPPPDPSRAPARGPRSDAASRQIGGGGDQLPPGVTR